jgi:hypothetical protein
MDYAWTMQDSKVFVTCYLAGARNRLDRQAAAGACDVTHADGGSKGRCKRHSLAPAASQDSAGSLNPGSAYVILRRCDQVVGKVSRATCQDDPTGISMVDKVAAKHSSTRFGSPTQALLTPHAPGQLTLVPAGLLQHLGQPGQQLGPRQQRQLHRRLRAHLPARLQAGGARPQQAQHCGAALAGGAAGARSVLQGSRPATTCWNQVLVMSYRPIMNMG